MENILEHDPTKVFADLIRAAKDAQSLPNLSTGSRLGDNIELSINEWLCSSDLAIYSEIQLDEDRQLCTLKISIINFGHKLDEFILPDQILIYNHNHYKINKQALAIIGQAQEVVLLPDLRTISTPVSLVFEAPKDSEKSPFRSGSSGQTKN